MSVFLWLTRFGGQFQLQGKRFCMLKDGSSYGTTLGYSYFKPYLTIAPRMTWLA